MLTVAVFFWRHLLTTDVLFFRDICFAHYPRAVELRTIVRGGVPPLWNPYEHFGEPVIANPNYLLFYPTAWLPWVLPPAYGFKLHYLLHFFLLAAGSFLLAWRVGLGAFPCYLAGALFVFSGPAMSLGNFHNMLPAAAWMAPALLAADFQMRHGGWRGAGLFAGALTLQLFAGAPLISIATVGLALAWAIAFHLDFRAPLLAGPNLRVFGRLLLPLALVAGLAAVQLIPTLWHLPQTQRAARLSFDIAFFWSLHPLKLIETLIPQFWGDILSHWRLPWLYLDRREPFLISLFIGLVPLGLALVAGLARKDRATRLWASVAIVALVLALGSYTAAAQIFYYVVPIFRFFRFPVKLLLPATLALSQLAAIGVDFLLNEKPGPHQAHQFRWLAGGSLAFGAAWVLVSAAVLLLPDLATQAAAKLAAMTFDHSFVLNLLSVLQMHHGQTVERAAQWLTSVIPARLPYVLVSVLLAASILYTRRSSAERPTGWFLPEKFHRPAVFLTALAGLLPLLVTHYGLNPLANRRFYEETPAALNSLRSAQPPLRIFAESVSTVPNLLPPALVKDWALMAFLPPPALLPYSMRLSLQLGAGMLGIENSFTADPEVLMPDHQRLLNSIVVTEKLTGQALARFLALSSVEYALVRRRIPGGTAPGFEQIGAFPNGTTLPVRAFRVSGALPRAYLVAARDAAVLPVGIPTLNRLVAEEFDPARQVVLERAEWGEGSLPARPPRLPETPGGAKIVLRNALRVEIEATAQAPAYLVLTDSYDPDWKVTVDGRPALLLRANQIFRAVAVPPGAHRIVFTYRPMSFYYGLALTLGTALMLILLAWREAQRKNQQGSQHSQTGR